MGWPANSAATYACTGDASPMAYRTGAKLL
jgi:succinate dehydrogenase/fumarate reductase flavoprotein subunit